MDSVIKMVKKQGLKCSTSNLKHTYDILTMFFK